MENSMRWGSDSCDPHGHGLTAIGHLECRLWMGAQLDEVEGGNGKAVRRSGQQWAAVLQMAGAY
jgi:hypothetical protein